MIEPPLAAPAPVPPKNSALAIWSMVLGILGIVILCVGPLFALPAVICGHVSSARINRSRGLLTGRGLALAGMITGYVSIALFAALTPIAIPNFLKAREVAICVIHLSKIDQAKRAWAQANNKPDGAPVTAADLKAYLTPADFKCPKGGDYTIGPIGQFPTCSIPEHRLPH